MKFITVIFFKQDVIYNVMENIKEMPETVATMIIKLKNTILSCQDLTSNSRNSYCSPPQSSSKII